MTRARLDGWMPVRVNGHVGFCSEFAFDSLLVDVPDATKLPFGPVRLELLCSPRVQVSVAAKVVDEADGAPAGYWRVEVGLATDAWSDEDRVAVQGHLSSLRKSAHLSITANEDVESTVRSGFDRARLPHRALPGVHMDAIDLRTTFLGKRLAAPLMIAGMTGGSERAGTVNRRLAIVCRQLGLGMGLGSQRAMLELPHLVDSFGVREEAPDILLLGNIGAVQLNLGVTVDDCQRLVDAVSADALAIHLNSLQEAVQPEGDRDWTDLLPRIEAVVRGLNVPVLVKEVGAGLDGVTAARLVDIGVSAIDVGGTGGTSWGWVEGFRTADPHRKAIAATFRDWGTPTAEAIRDVRAAVGDRAQVQATGGLRTGLDVAKALALGADVGGMALPFFRAADESVDEALALGRRVIEEIRIAALCTGSADMQSLRGVDVEFS
jgi:isopentenyl-diphosphate delta-isomerase